MSPQMPSTQPLNLCSFTARTRQIQQEPSPRGGQRRDTRVDCPPCQPPTANRWGRRRNSSGHLCNSTKIQKELMVTISYTTQGKVRRQDKH